jgi:hypothetical protein
VAPVLVAEQEKEVAIETEIEQVKDLLRQAFAILSRLDKPNIRTEALQMLAAKPAPQPLPIVAALPEPPEQDE